MTFKHFFLIGLIFSNSLLAWKNFSLNDPQTVLSIPLKEGVQTIELPYLSTPDLQKTYKDFCYTTSLKDGRRIHFYPFLGKKEDIKGIGNMLSEEKAVYSRLRHQGPWSDALLSKTFLRYAQGVKKVLKSFANHTFSWDKDFDLSFVFYIEEKEGHKSFAGRGGFQAEDSFQPESTEIYFAVMPQFQNLGIATAFTTFALSLWKNKFNTYSMPLRGLYLSSNSISKKVLEKMGMHPLQKDGKTFETRVKEWNNALYKVMEV